MGGVLARRRSGLSRGARADPLLRGERLRAPALVGVDAAPQAFRALFEAASARGVRVGWLELDRTLEPPAELGAAAQAGAFKSVVAARGASVALKTTRGEPVLRDLLREHFLGCALVLVRGRAGKPRLAAEAGAYRFEPSAGRERRLGAAELLDELLRPRHRA